MKITLRSHGCMCKGPAAGLSIEKVPTDVKSLKIYGYPGEITLSVIDDATETPCNVNTKRTAAAYYLNLCYDFALANKLKAKPNDEIKTIRDELFKDLTFKMFSFHLPGDSYIDKEAFYPVEIMVCDRDAAPNEKKVILPGSENGSIKLSELILEIINNGSGLGIEGTLKDVEFEVISCACGPQMPFPADTGKLDQSEGVQKIIEACEMASAAK